MIFLKKQNHVGKFPSHILKFWKIIPSLQNILKEEVLWYLHFIEFHFCFLKYVKTLKQKHVFIE